MEILSARVASQLTRVSRKRRETLQPGDIVHAPEQLRYFGAVEDIAVSRLQRIARGIERIVDGYVAPRNSLTDEERYDTSNETYGPADTRQFILDTYMAADELVVQQLTEAEYEVHLSDGGSRFTDVDSMAIPSIYVSRINVTWPK